MKLLYIWIKKSFNGVIQEEGFPISSEYEYELKDKELRISVNNDYIPDFFNLSNEKPNQIVELTAVVGENGSGKTTLLREIKNKSIAIKYCRNKNTEYKDWDDNWDEKSKVILVFKDSDGTVKVSSNVDEFQFYYNDSVIVPIHLGCNEDKSSTKEFFTYIYLSNAFSDDCEMQGSTQNYNMYSDIFLTTYSLNQLAKIFIDKELMYKKTISTFNLNKYFKEIMDITLENQSEDYKLQQNYLNLKYCYDFKDKRLPYKSFRGLKISAKNLIRYENYFDKNIYNDKDKIPVINEDLNINIKRNISNIYIYFYLEFKKYESKNSILGLINVINLYTEIAYVFGIHNISSFKYGEKQYKNYKSILNSMYDNSKDLIENLEMLSNNLKLLMSDKVKIKKDEKIIDEEIYDYKELIKFYKKEIKCCIDFISKAKEFKAYANSLPENDLGHFKYLKLDFEDIKDSEFIKFILDNYYNLIKYMNVDFCNYLSGGEEAMLNLYSRLYWFVTSQKDNLKDTLILLLDEIDLYLHPEWQRSFILHFLGTVTQITNKKIQIILTTHSPICLSDIPIQNIIFMKPKKEIKRKICCVSSEFHDNTFGQNIYTLLKNEFFMKSTMGEFATYKIKNKILKELQKDDFKDENGDLLKLINLIGEPLIKNKLLNMYEEKKDVTKNFLRKINDLENEVEKLRSINGDGLGIDKIMENLKVKIEELKKGKNNDKNKY
ncbi:AAA family ATPase [Clostridium felsineum]|uniref:AAA family ATPase n=1 Tax=Clostridium felsineum TaxID=36839 RepID=UPI00098C88BA|nr:AAA family ATPase [Clostridium felsineum]URZ04136.1 hypothetical protein CLAUR_042240 [Clostridium felsineum]